MKDKHSDELSVEEAKDFARHCVIWPPYLTDSAINFHG
jgi:hypothetical protein